MLPVLRTHSGLRCRRHDDVAVVSGTFDITFADHVVQAPTAPMVLSVADTGTVELQLFLTHA